VAVSAGIAFLFPSAVFALDIEEAIWGIGSQQTKGECIPLSLLLSNNTPEVFDELVQLNQLQFGSSKVGAPLYRKVYLAPYTSQWVQFYPYILSQRQTDWSLNWGPGNIYSLGISKTGSAPANVTQESTENFCVILASIDSLSDSGIQFKRFPEELFPPQSLQPIRWMKLFWIMFRAGMQHAETPLWTGSIEEEFYTYSRIFLART